MKDLLNWYCSMRLVACLNIPSLPLQIALGRNPEWKDHPAVITRDDKPTSIITHASKKALAKQISVGSRYADALSLVPELRATHIEQEDIESELSAIIDVVYQFSPEIEACPIDKESLWVNASGLTSLFNSIAEWSEALQAALKTLGYFARVIVGYTRMGTYIAARDLKSSRILNSEAAERDLVDEAPLSLLPLSLRSQKLLKRLGINSLADLKALPLDGSIKRFGEELKLVLGLFAKEQFIPIQFMHFDDPALIYRNLDSPLFSLGLVLEELGPLIDKAITRAQAKHLELSKVEVLFFFEDGTTDKELVSFAQPCLDKLKIMRLIELRLAKRQFKEGIVRLELTAHEIAPRRIQQDFFESKDAEFTLEKAFALIRARLGNEAIVVAKLKPRHLPEESYFWEPVHSLAPITEAAPRDQKPRLVRRIYPEPIEITKKINRSKVISKPIYQSGSWWKLSDDERAYRRSYLFYQNAGGEILWIYEDLDSKRLWLQGVLD